jgi:hypothetical protein
MATEWWVGRGRWAAAIALAALFQMAPSGLSAQKTLCFNGSRLPVCSNFLIVEMQGVLPAAQTSRTITWVGGEAIDRTTFDDRLEWHLGLMHNVGERWAVGGAVGVGTGAANALTSLTARGRRWITDDVALDVGGGVLFGPQEVGGGTRNGTLVDARLNFNDDVYGGVRWEQMNVRPATDFGSALVRARCGDGVGSRRHGGARALHRGHHRAADRAGLTVSRAAACAPRRRARRASRPRAS